MELRPTVFINAYSGRFDAIRGRIYGQGEKKDRHARGQESIRARIAVYAAPDGWITDGNFIR